MVQHFWRAHRPKGTGGFHLGPGTRGSAREEVGSDRSGDLKGGPPAKGRPLSPLFWLGDLVPLLK